MIPVYRDDPYRTELITIIDAVIPRPEGVAVICRENLYAEGGGQPADHGSIEAAGETRTIHALIKEKGNVALLIDPIPGLEKGREIKCSLDFERRYRIMRLHTAQHIVSALIKQRDHSYETRDMTMNEDASSCTLVFSSEHVFREEEMREVFTSLEKIVAEDRPVKPVSFEKLEEASAFFGTTMRYSPSRGPIKGKIRFMYVEGVDANPCGGTHVRSTKEIAGVHFDSASCDPATGLQTLMFHI